MTQRYKAIISYNGSNYHGWARQPNSITIQEILENTINKVFNQKVKVFAAGRTDAGVNALGQVIHFDFKNVNIKPNDIKFALNKALPYDIRINKVQTVNKDFNARFNAIKKTYIYYINTNNIIDAIQSSHIYQYNKPLNISKIKKIKKEFIGSNNFLSFSTDERNGQSLIREILDIKVKEDKKLVSISITGTGFLRSQVRMMVGSMIAFSENKININDIKSLLNNPQKGKAIYKAPACGLTLFKVYY